MCKHLTKDNYHFIPLDQVCIISLLQTESCRSGTAAIHTIFKGIVQLLGLFEGKLNSLLASHWY